MLREKPMCDQRAQLIKIGAIVLSAMHFNLHPNNLFHLFCILLIPVEIKNMHIAVK